MISLQTAILLAGIIVFFVVLIVSYDRYRANKRDEEARQETDYGLALLHPRKNPGSAVFERQPILSADPSTRKEPQLDSDGEAPLAVDPDEPSAGVSNSVAEDDQQLPHRATAEPRDHAGGDDTQEEDKLPLELVARIPGSNVINRDTALGIYRQFEFDIKKRCRIFGLCHPDGNWGNLEKQPESAKFTDFGISVQLADRSGPISESELNHFSQLILRFAEVFGRRFKFSISLNDALAHARKLDEFCKNYDSVAILNVVARNQDFRGSDVHRCARELGMQLSKRSIYEKRYPNVHAGKLHYSMASLTQDGKLPPPAEGDFLTRGLTLFMNIPRSENPPHVFNDMVGDAKHLCQQLNGTLVDHNLRGMTQKALKRISQQIRQIVHEMEQEGVTPGGDKSLRLF
jgi:hypothetical protein